MHMKRSKIFQSPSSHLSKSNRRSIFSPLHATPPNVAANSPIGSLQTPQRLITRYQSGQISQRSSGDQGMSPVSRLKPLKAPVPSSINLPESIDSSQSLDKPSHPLAQMSQQSLQKHIVGLVIGLNDKFKDFEAILKDYHRLELENAALKKQQYAQNTDDRWQELHNENVRLWQQMHTIKSIILTEPNSIRCVEALKYTLQLDKHFK